MAKLYNVHQLAMGREDEDRALALHYVTFREGSRAPQPNPEPKVYRSEEEIGFIEHEGIRELALALWKHVDTLKGIEGVTPEISVTVKIPIVKVNPVRVNS